MMRGAVLVFTLLLTVPAAAESLAANLDKYLSQFPEEQRGCITDALFLDAGVMATFQETGKKTVTRSTFDRFQRECIDPLSCPAFSVAAETVDRENDTSPFLDLYRMAYDLCSPNSKLTLHDRCFLIAKGADIREDRHEARQGGLEAARKWSGANDLFNGECLRPIADSCKSFREYIASDEGRRQLVQDEDRYFSRMMLAKSVCPTAPAWRALDGDDAGTYFIDKRNLLKYRGVNARMKFTPEAGGADVIATYWFACDDSGRYERTSPADAPMTGVFEPKIRHYEKYACGMGARAADAIEKGEHEDR